MNTQLPQTSHSEAGLNRLFSASFRISLSNIPTWDPKAVINIAMFNDFVKSISLPAYTAKLYDLPFKQIVRKEPLQQYNREFPPITLEFFVNEDLYNYLTIFYYVLGMHTEEFPIGKDQMHLAQIQLLAVQILDNHNRPTATLKFKYCFVTSISGLIMSQGDPSELSFSIEVQPQDVEYVIETRTPS